MPKLKLKSFFKSESGATAVEFAIISVVFLLCVFGIMEFARVLWVQQALQDVAQKSARCSVIGSGENSIQCMSTTEVINFAVNEASDFGIRIPDSTVNVDLNIMCNGYNANRVTINVPTNSPVGKLIPQIQQNILVDGCFPAG